LPVNRFHAVLIQPLSLAVFLVACTEASDQPKAENLSTGEQVVVARVNGEAIYEANVLRRMRAAHGDDIEPLKSDPNRWRMLFEVALDTEITDKLLLQTAVAEGMSVPAEEAEELVARTKSLAGEDAFKQMLKERGATEDAFRDFLVEQELIGRYKEKLFSSIEVDDDALENYYDGHPESFAEPEQVRLETFTFDVSDTADRIHARWAGGESFDEIAQTYLAEAEKVGRRTRWMPIDAVPEGFRQKVAAGAPGDILEPARVADKFYVVRILEKRDARIRTFEEVKEEILGMVTRLLRNKRLDEWYQSASREGKIEFVRYSNP
jgi:parvulin-like peptidyl-prolyl isomerase